MRGRVVALSLALAAVLRFYTVASAHVTLVSSVPAAGATLVTSPTSLRLEFSEPVEPAVAHVSIVAPNGRSTALSVANDPHDTNVIVAPLSGMVSGTFRV